MSLFKKKKSDKQFKIELENAALEQKMMKDSFEGFNSSFNENSSKKAPMVLTLEELNGHTSAPEFDDFEEENTAIINMDQEVPKTVDFLFTKMIEAREEAKENLNKNNETTKNAENDNAGTQNSNSSAQKNDDNLPESIKNILNNKTQNNILTEQPKFSTLEKETKNILRDKCQSFTEGADKSQTEVANVVKLQSVEEILAEMEQKAKNKVEQMYKNNGSATESTEKKEEVTKEQLNKKVDPEYKVIKPQNNITDEKDQNLQPENDIIESEYVDAEDILDNKAFSYSLYSVTDTKEAKNAVEEFFKSNEEEPKNDDLKTETTDQTDIKNDEADTLNTEDNLYVDEYIDSKAISKDTIMFSVPDKEDISSKSDENLYSTNIFSAISKEIENTNIESANSDEDLNEEYEPEIEYNSKGDRPFVYKHISKKLRNIKLRIFGSSLLAILTLIFELPQFFENLKFAAFAAFALCILININMLSSIINVFKLKNSVTLPVAITTVISAVYNTLIVFKFNDTPTFMFATTVLLLLSNIGISFKYSRIFKNFKLVTSNNIEKQALSFCKDGKILKQISKTTDYDDVYFLTAEKTSHINGFMKYSLGYEPNFKLCMVVYLFVLILSLAGAVGAYLSAGLAAAFTVFIMGLIISGSASLVFINYLPLKIAATRLHYYGSALFGHKSCEELNLTNTVVVNVGDIFPKGSVKLIDFKLLSPNPIDQTLIDAATLSHNINSPLSGIFKQITDLTDAKIPPVDSVTYEENMGISGWVDNRRVFIGNRTLLEAHGFKLPSIEIDKKILTKGYFPVYLGSEGVLCALLIIKYEPQSEVCYELRRLASTGVNIIVNNCDQNVSAPMLIDYLDLFEGSVYVMNSSLRTLYKDINTNKENVTATAMCSNNICGFAATITASIKIIKLNKIMAAIFAIISIGSAAAVCALGFMGYLNLITSVIAGLWNIVSILLCSITAYISRP